MRTNEKEVSFLNTLKVSLVPRPQEESFHVMCVRKQHAQEPKEPRDCDWDHFVIDKQNLPRNMVVVWS